MNHVDNIAELPTEQVEAIFHYGMRQLVSDPDIKYYANMVSIAAEELAKRKSA